jgi:hypothetical protein
MAIHARTMKRFLFVALVISLTTSSLTIAQTQCRPDGFGGMNCYGPSGNTQIRPDGFGGYNTYGR